MSGVKIKESAFVEVGKEHYIPVGNTPYEDARHITIEKLDQYLKGSDTEGGVGQTFRAVYDRFYTNEENITFVDNKIERYKDSLWEEIHYLEDQISGISGNKDITHINLAEASNEVLLNLFNDIYDRDPKYLNKIVHYMGKPLFNWCTYGTDEVRFYHTAICTNSEDYRIHQSDRPFYVSLTKSDDQIKVTHVETDDVCINVVQNQETWTFELEDGTTVTKNIVIA